MVSHRNVPFSCFCCPREMGCNMLPTAASKQDCPHGSCKAMGLRRDKFLSLTIANGLQADWQLQSTQFPALVVLTRHLWDCTLRWWRKEAEQVCFHLFLYCTSICFSPQLARPRAQFRSSNKSLFMRHGNPPALSTPLGLDCPGMGYFGHHRWFLHLTERREGASRCLTTTLLCHSPTEKLSSVKALISPLDLEGWDAKRGVQRVGFTGETQQNFQHQDWELLLRQKNSRADRNLCPEQSNDSPHI